MISIIPIILQIIIETISHYKLQHLYCFSIIKLLNQRINQWSNDIEETYLDIIPSIRKDSYETLITLITYGYVTQPMIYIIEHIDTIDGDIIRYILYLYIKNIKGPYSIELLEKLIELLNNESVIKAVRNRKEFIIHLSNYQEEIKVFSQNQSFGIDERQKYQELENVLQQMISKIGSSRF